MSLSQRARASVRELSRIYLHAMPALRSFLFRLNLARFSIEIQLGLFRLQFLS